MNASLDELYFDWLYDQVRLSEADDPSRNYSRLLHILFTKEFRWMVPNDDNRLEDGTDLRVEFLRDSGIPPRAEDGRWMDLGCSALELLIGLSRRFAFMTGRTAADCFWELIENSELDQFSDEVSYNDLEVDHILNRIMWRTYDRDGYGGLFPLERPRRDQRKVELWAQLNAYILERI